MVADRPPRFPYQDEDTFIAALRRTLPDRSRVRVGIGDDAAVLADGTVVSTDGYLEGVHFDRRYLAPVEIGTRCACAALSDIVAMGVRPGALFVTLGLPRGTGRRDVRALYRGLDTVCARLGCSIAGGDTIASARMLLALTAIGRTRRPLLRSAARPGQTLYVTGRTGAAETGRLLLARNPGASRRHPAIARHIRPLPRMRTMLALCRHIGALIDTSDGIAADARRIARASGVRVVIEPERLPTLPATRRYCRETGKDLTDFALTAGEDYELLFSSDHIIGPVVAGIAITSIGRIERGQGVWLAGADRTRRLTMSGYDHFNHPA